MVRGFTDRQHVTNKASVRREEEHAAMQGRKALYFGTSAINDHSV